MIDPKERLVHGDWNAICDRCGFKFKASELKKTWDNLYVCEKDFELRQPQDFLKSRRDNQAVAWTRPDVEVEAGGVDINGNVFPPVEGGSPAVQSDALSVNPYVKCGGCGEVEAAAPVINDYFMLTFNIVGDGETLVIPCDNVGTFDAVIDWADGSTSEITSYNDANLAHVYATAGIYKISISGTFPNIWFSDDAESEKLLSVDNIGNTGLVQLWRGFYGCTNMTSVTAGDSVTPLLTDMRFAFSECTSLVTLDLTGLDVSAVTIMTDMVAFDPSLTTVMVSDFDTSSLTRIDDLFAECTSLVTLDMGSWDMSKVTLMSYAFAGCTALETMDVSAWDTGLVTDMWSMFSGCPNLIDLAVDGWDVSNCTDLDDFLTGSSIPTARYDATLIAWDALTVQPGITADFGSSKYTGGGAAAAAKLSLETADTWTIKDGGIA